MGRPVETTAKEIKDLNATYKSKSITAKHMIKEGMRRLRDSISDSN